MSEETHKHDKKDLPICQKRPTQGCVMFGWICLTFWHQPAYTLKNICQNRPAFGSRDLDRYASHLKRDLHTYQKRPTWDPRIFQKRPTYTSKEIYRWFARFWMGAYHKLKRDLRTCQKRPTNTSKETHLRVKQDHTHVKRDVLLCHKRPTFCLRTFG